MTTQAQVQVPSNWGGSLPEYVAYTTFMELGKRPGEDFFYQSPAMGGRMTKGGIIIDFLFNSPPDLAVNIQGVYYHYVAFGVETKARDTLARAALAGDGIMLIFVDDDMLLEDPKYYCREALQYRDHSRLGGNA